MTFENSCIWIVTIHYSEGVTEKRAYDNEYHATRHYKYEKSKERHVELDKLYINQLFE